MHAYIYLCKNIIGRLNIGDYIQKLPIAKVYSSPIFHLIRYFGFFKSREKGLVTKEYIIMNMHLNFQELYTSAY